MTLIPHGESNGYSGLGGTFGNLMAGTITIIGNRIIGLPRLIGDIVMNHLIAGARIGIMKILAAVNGTVIHPEDIIMPDHIMQPDEILVPGLTVTVVGILALVRSAMAMGTIVHGQPTIADQTRRDTQVITKGAILIKGALPIKAAIPIKDNHPIMGHIINR